MSNSVQIWTDGSVYGNRGNGGWAAIIKEGKSLLCFGGYADDATSAQMELQAVLESIQIIPTQKTITVFTDSQYVVKGLRNGGDVKSYSRIWRDIFSLVDAYHHKIKSVHVKAHSGNIYNEMADVCARYCRDSRLPLYERWSNTQSLRFPAKKGWL